MYIKTSVRKLIEFVMRSGDIDNSFRDNNRMVEGIKAHQKIQKSYDKNYQAEFYLKNITKIDDMEFHVEGRADGLLKKKGKKYIKCWMILYRMFSKIKILHLMFLPENFQERSMKG